MTPWQNERWACAPTNDGRNFAPAHRWAVVEARPLCFGLLRSRYGVQVVSSEPCWCGKCAHVIACIEAGDEVEDASADYAALARSCIREAHELRWRLATLEAAPQRQVDNVQRWMETGVPADAAESQSIYEQMVCALRRKLPRRPDCLRSMDIKE